MQEHSHFKTISHISRLMRLVGFNGREIREGTCHRGKKKTPADNPETKKTDNEPGSKIRGPVCPGFIASSVAAIAAKALEKMFNQAITILAAHKSRANPPAMLGRIEKAML
jgi:hypothetical protein